MRSMCLRHTLWTLPALAAGIIACGGDQGSQPAVPTRVLFTAQPTNATAGAAISPAVTVTVQDAAGNTVTGATTSITLALGTNPATGTLSGTTTVAAVSGVATFSTLSIDKAGSGYTLTATAPSLTGATSSAFNIQPPAPTRLTFTVQPSNAPLGSATPISPAIQVAILDAAGNVATAATTSISVAIGTNPTGGTLSGTTTVSAVDGVATFADLSIATPGIGYTLTASASGLSGSTSGAFDLVSRGNFACGVTTGGAAYCWGSNGLGQLGYGSTVTVNAASPVTVPGGFAFALVSAGPFVSCGVTTGGAAHCWGYNTFGQLGNGSATRGPTTPVAVAGGLTFASVSAGSTHACGVTTGAAAYCWGRNSLGQLGNGSTTNTTTPVAVSGGLTFASVSAGGGHACGVTTGGAAYCWGLNSSGQLGDGSTTNSTIPVAVSGGLTFGSVSAGSSHTCGVTTGSAAYCWGSNGLGQLGDGSTTNSTTPVAVLGGLTFASVSAGPGHACGVTTGGAAYCWGINGGRLGNGSTTNSTTPVAVSGGLTFASVSASGNATCGVAAGAAYCWGLNFLGQLGIGSTMDSTTPAAVSGGLTFTSVSAR